MKKKKGQFQQVFWETEYLHAKYKVGSLPYLYNICKWMQMDLELENRRAKTIRSQRWKRGKLCGIKYGNDVFGSDTKVRQQ
jgi:hypothetical protein